MSAARQTIGFVGLGHMGGNMAARYLAAGHAVYGESRSREGTEQLVEGGLQWRDTPREIAESVDVVFTSIPNDEVLEEIAAGPNGVLAGLDAGKVWVDMSTVSPRVSREVAEHVRATGAFMLDAPVSGSVPQVESGTLTIMVGGTSRRFSVSSRCSASSAPRPTSAITGTASSSSWRSTSASPCRCWPSPRGC
jgi:3-hydroxyisobutyrate dehydrogenase-like beta-hydroxyacid dehydrogenase